MSKMKIGVTERGDAGLDLSWETKLNGLSAAILITKNITPHFRAAVLRNMRRHNLILHCGCTGWGHSPVEPNVPYTTEQLAALDDLIQFGFPVEQTVLRIDPILPIPSGLQAANNVLNIASKYDWFKAIRIRISIMDDYAHVKRRFQNAGYATVYPGQAKFASPEQFEAVKRLCAGYPDKIFETCAETGLNGPQFRHTGCVSEADLSIFGLTPESSGQNPQNRNGCLCLSCKTELLSHKSQCPHKCLYCYWCGKT